MNRARKSERITASSRIDDLMEALVRERSPAWLRVTPDTCVPVHGIRTDQNGLILEPAPVAMGPLYYTAPWSNTVPPTTLTLEWTGYNSLYSTSSEPHTDEHGALRMRAPGVVDRVQHRAFRRVLLSSHVVVRCLRTNGAVRLLALRDVSCEGLSVWLEGSAEAPLMRGEVCSLSVIGSDGPSIALHGDVRSLSDPQGGGAPFLGFRIRPASSLDGEAWLRFLERQLHPRVRIGNDGLAEIWTLLVAAGYFSLSGKRPEDFEERRAGFVAATRRALEAPSVGLQATWPESGPAVATLSAVRLYENSWLGYQMAKCSGRAPDGTPGRLVLREIHLSIYERIQRDPSARWIVGHTQVRPVWSRHCHFDIAERYVATGDAAIWRFRAVEVQARPLATPLPAGVSIGPATQEETASVLSSWARARPEALVEALDLVPRRFDLQEVRRRWWAGGLERDRALLVARRDGVLLAAIVLELADDGMHLFRLLDHALPLALDPAGDALLPSLLGAAHAWYGERGRAGWVFYLDAATPMPVDPGMVDMGEADMCILSTARLSEFLEHVHEITADCPEGAPPRPPMELPSAHLARRLETVTKTIASHDETVGSDGR